MKHLRGRHQLMARSLAVLPRHWSRQQEVQPAQEAGERWGEGISPGRTELCRDSRATAPLASGSAWHIDTLQHRLPPAGTCALSCGCESSRCGWEMKAGKAGACAGSMMLGFAWALGFFFFSAHHGVLALP